MRCVLTVEGSIIFECVLWTPIRIQVYFQKLRWREGRSERSRRWKVALSSVFESDNASTDSDFVSLPPNRQSETSSALYHGQGGASQYSSQKKSLVSSA